MVKLLLYYYLTNPSVSKLNSYSFTDKHKHKLDSTNILFIYFTHLNIFYTAKLHIQKHTLILTIHSLNKLLRCIFKVALGSIIIYFNSFIHVYICLHGRHVNIFTYYITFVNMQNYIIIGIIKLCVKYHTCMNEIFRMYLLIFTHHMLIKSVLTCWTA